MTHLLFLETKWYGIFQGLVWGRAASGGTVLTWDPPPFPKPSGISKLDAERMRERNKKLRAGEWTPVLDPIAPGIPAEPEIWEMIKMATKPEHIWKACDTSPFWLNPKKNRSVWAPPGDLRNHAAEFLTCKKYRYPVSSRPSSEQKRIIHFSRAMAGIMQGIGPARAIDLLRDLDHGKNCPCVTCAVEKQSAL
jgi:hypothetical protein